MGTFGVVGVLQLLGSLLFVLIALVGPTMFAPTFQRIEDRLAPLANNPRRQLVVVGLLALIARGALLPWFPPPSPIMADEYSLLFQAQLMVEGRWALPADPMWRHFEEMHVIATPAYASIYFPGRSVLPAIGILLGHSWIGIWLGMVAMCVAVTWMLQGWVRLPYALIGGVLTVLHYGVFNYWVNGFWGGSFTALGATLTLGAMPRLMNKARWRDGIIAGIGVVFMMTSRPFEAALLCLGIAVAMLPWLYRTIRAADLLSVSKLVLPIAVLVVAGGAVMLSHSAAITGNPLKPAYQLGREQYAVTPALLISAPLPPPTWPDKRMERVFRLEALDFRKRNSPKAVAKIVRQRLIRLATFYVGPALFLPFALGLWELLRSRSLVLLPAILIVTGFLLTSWDFPHYAAPLAPIAMLSIVMGLDRLRHLDYSTRPAGLALSRLLPMLLALNFLIPLAHKATGWPTRIHNHWSHACCAIASVSIRKQVEVQLDNRPGPDLAFVRYRSNSNLMDNWVYNEPSYAQSPIIWARYRDAESNKAFAARFPDRRVWIVEPGPRDAASSPYIFDR